MLAITMTRIISTPTTTIDEGDDDDDADDNHSSGSLETETFISWPSWKHVGFHQRRHFGCFLNFWYCFVSIVGTLGCVFIDNETHESGVTACTTGEAWSTFSWNHSSVFQSWKLGINFTVCIKWIDWTWWHNRLVLVPNCYEVVAMVATMVAMVAPLWCHTLR